MFLPKRNLNGVGTYGARLQTVKSTGFVARIKTAMLSGYTRERLASFTGDDHTMILREHLIKGYGSFLNLEYRAMHPFVEA